MKLMIHGIMSWKKKSMKENTIKPEIKVNDQF